MKKIYYMMLLALMSIGMTSCDGWDSPYYVEDIVGSWVSYYGHDGYGEYDILGYDQVRYDFYSNYTGRYTYYSYYGLSYVDFDWDAHNGRLIIHYYDGDSEYLYYGYDYNGDLLLATDSRFYHYTAYRPAGIYCSPAQDVTTLEEKAGAKKISKEAATDTDKSVSRAVKARNEVNKE